MIYPHPNPLPKGEETPFSLWEKSWGCGEGMFNSFHFVEINKALLRNTHTIQPDRDVGVSAGMNPDRHRDGKS